MNPVAFSKTVFVHGLNKAMLRPPALWSSHAVGHRMPQDWDTRPGHGRSGSGSDFPPGRVGHGGIKTPWNCPWHKWRKGLRRSCLRAWQWYRKWCYSGSCSRCCRKERKGTIDKGPVVGVRVVFVPAAACAEEKQHPAGNRVHGLDGMTHAGRLGRQGQGRDLQAGVEPVQVPGG